MRSHNRKAEREVFLELDRICIPNPVAVYPRHQRHVEAGAIGRDLFIWPEPKQKHVGILVKPVHRARSVADQHERHVWKLPCDPLQEFEIDQVVVEASKEANSGAGNRGKVGGQLMLLSSSKVLYIHAVVEEVPTPAEQIPFFVLQRTAGIKYMVRIGHKQCSSARITV